MSRSDGGRLIYTRDAATVSQTPSAPVVITVNDSYVRVNFAVLIIMSVSTMIVMTAG